jgi:hypothetical protein
LWRSGTSLRWYGMTYAPRGLLISIFRLTIGATLSWVRKLLESEPHLRGSHPEEVVGNDAQG